MRRAAYGAALAAMAPWIPSCLGMRRKAVDAVDFNFNANASVKSDAGADRLAEGSGVLACPGHLWTLGMSSEHGQGWRGAFIHIARCNGTSIANMTLLADSSNETSFCLPAKFMVDVRNESDAAGVQWFLANNESKSLSGGAPYSNSLCDGEEEEHIPPLVVSKEAEAVATNMDATVDDVAHAPRKHIAPHHHLMKTETESHSGVWSSAFRNYWNRYESRGEVLNVQHTMMREMIGMQFR